MVIFLDNTGFDINGFYPMISYTMAYKVFMDPYT